MKKLSNYLNFIYSRDNHIVNSFQELNDRQHKNYNAECGNGFYFTKDFEIAKKYAFNAVKTRGGKPIVNVSTLDKEKILEDITVNYRWLKHSGSLAISMWHILILFKMKRH